MGQRHRYPPRGPEPLSGVVWVLTDNRRDDDEEMPGMTIGAYSTRRNAIRGLIQHFIEWDGRPLARLHSLTWETGGWSGWFECWNDERWGDTDCDAYRCWACKIDENAI